MADAGWYPDPQDPQSLQYFDGQAWTGQRRPVTDPGSQPAAGSQSAPTSADTQLPWQQGGAGGQGAPIAAAQQPAWQSTSETQQNWQTPTPTPAATAAPAWSQPQEQGSQWQQGQAGPAQAAGPWQPQGQPGQGQGQQGQPGQPGPWQPGQYGQPGPSRKRSRKPLIIGLVAVLVIAAGLVTYLVWPSDNPPSLTYKGKEIASAADLLKSTEANVLQDVKTRHGAKNANTRCYFTQQEKPSDGAKKSDIGDNLRCGPVLFVDGNKSNSYLPVPITQKGDSSGKVELQSQQTLDDIQPAALDPGVKLVRPDDKTAVAGSGGLALPTPPPAAKDLLIAGSLGSTAPPPAVNAEMIGKNTKTTLTRAGEITRYGTGDDARSAPAGQRLIAFQVTYGAGDVSGDGSAHPHLVSGGHDRAIPVTPGSDDWVIAAVQTGSSPILSMNNGGFTQTLSLPAGKPGSNNIAVLSREHRTSFVDKKVSVGVHLSEGGNSLNQTWKMSATIASLDFWIPGHETRHASSPNHGILSVRLNYTDGEPGGPYGVDPQLLQLKLPNGSIVHARNVAATHKIFDVFEVPADFTNGTLMITGSEKVNGINVKVTSPKNISVGIPAG